MTGRRWLALVALVLVAAAAFLAGRYVGFWSGYRLLERPLENEVAGNLSLLVESLPLAREGSSVRAVDALELSVQHAVTSLPWGRAWEGIPDAQRRALVIAKRYLEAYPPAEPLPDLEAALEAIGETPIDPESCSPAVKRLLEGKAPEYGSRETPFRADYCTQHGPISLWIEGDLVAGVFAIRSNGDVGAISGTLEGDLMRGEWIEPDSAGRMEIRFVKNRTRFEARYDVAEDRGIWYEGWIGRLRAPGATTLSAGGLTLLCD